MKGTATGVELVLTAKGRSSLDANASALSGRRGASGGGMQETPAPMVDGADEGSIPMPISSSYPGVFVEEIPRQPPAIVPAPTAITAFIGRMRRGPLDEPVSIASFAECERQFGGLWQESTVSFAVQHYFLNGGVNADVVRVHNPSTADGDDLARVSLPDEGDGAPLVIAAANPGAWGNRLRVIVDHDASDAADPSRFTLTAEEVDPGDLSVVLATETFRALSVDPRSPRFVADVLTWESRLIRVSGYVPANRPAATPRTGPPLSAPIPAVLQGGDDGQPIDDAQISDPRLRPLRRGLWALDNAAIVNLLCIPPLGVDRDVAPSTWEAARAYCKQRRAMLLVDPPAEWQSADDVLAGIAAVDRIVMRDENAALFFPRLRAPNPLAEGRRETFAPGGAVAGVFARIDAAKGVWTAPAGPEATLAGVSALAVKLSDEENGQLTAQGVNCLRDFPIGGPVIWGARTLRGADALASEWKYISVRRLMLFIEQSLVQGLGWIAFEPNDESLWSAIRLTVGAFLENLFRQDAFSGVTPRDAYFVKCDAATMTEDDIANGIVTIIVGFAPLRPAEFVIIEIRQQASQPES
jgi:phage tail sheath protein FI